MRLPRIFRTTPFRLALLYAGLLAVTSAVLFGFIYVAITDFAEEQLKAGISSEVSVLVDEAQSDGLEMLAKTIAIQLERFDPHHSSYLLKDSQGRRLAGNLANELPAQGWANVELPVNAVRKLPATDQTRERGKGIAFIQPLAGGGTLVVAHSTEELDELNELVISAFAAAGLVSTAMALLTGYLLSSGLLKRIETFNDTASRIIGGNLNDRVPVRGTDDEFDRLATSINRMLDRLQELMVGLKSVSTDIAHDLRTPLSRLRQRLENAQAKATSPEEYAQAVDVALADTDGLLSIFNALLRIAQIESGSRKAAFSTVDLSNILERMRDAYVDVAEDAGRRLVCRIEPNVSCRGDQDLLVQMFANLVENAILHTPAGSNIELVLTLTGGRPVAQVAYNGPGIPAESRDKVFRRFFRLDQSRSTPGNGLGLSLVAAVADLHDIELQLADNQPGLRAVLKFPAVKT